MSVFHRMTAAGVVLSGLLLSTAVPARANGHEKCEKEIHEAEEELHKAIERHGADSRDAHYRRHELDEVRDRCRHKEHERHEKLEKEHHELHEELEKHDNSY